MSSWFIHPRYLSAYAAAADRDPDLRKGTHLRLFPSELLGFPLAPWRLWHQPARITDVPVQWFDRHNRPLPAPDLDAADGEAIGWISSSLPDQARLIGVEVQFAAGGPGEIAVLDRVNHRVIASRSWDRLLVGAPQITRVRLRGRGPFELLGWQVSPGDMFERLIGSNPFASLSTPLDGDFPWYAGGEGPVVAAKRVAAGAPRRWTRPDRPDGPFDPLSPAAEEARVAVFRPDLDEEVHRLVSDPDTRPGAVTRTHVSPAGPGHPWQEVTEHIQGSLLLKALDPGVGRYLGLLTLLEHLPDMDERPQSLDATAWLAAGLFACVPGARIELPVPDERERRLIERLMELEPSVRRTIEMATGRNRWTIRAFVTAALAAPVQDLPAAPAVVLGDSAWLREKQGPSVAFRQQFRVIAPPLAALIALGRLESQGWVTRHELVELGAGLQPDRRAAPQLLGSTHTLSAGRFGVVEESRITVDGASWTYQLALSDVFGRFGAPNEINVSLPARPAIPVPTVRVQLKLSDRAAHDQPAVAGSMRVTVPVPALEELTAGSRPLSRVLINLAGASQDAPTPQAGGILTFEFILPTLLPMEHRRFQLRARFENDQGALGDEGIAPVDITDPRSPPIPKTGIGIVWSSRPGPAEAVEIRVRFAGTGGARYRVYSSDARGLDIPLTTGGRPRTRAEVAIDGAQRGLNGLGLRERFRLVTESPIQAGVDGTVLFDARFPRSLQTVQFLRFVPLGQRGAEAAFESCPLLPVAVPSDRQPPAPRVEVWTDSALGTAQVSVIAEGLDLVALEAAEPGLFLDPPAPAARPPKFRLRRASGAVPDALYAREIARGSLMREGNQFKVVIADHPGSDGLIPFVRYHYWAEVRMPPERRLPPGTQEIILPSGSIQPLQPVQRQDAPAAYSLASAPAMAMRVPAEAATLESEMVSARIGAAAGGWRLSLAITGGPRAHPRAVGGYRVQIHMERETGVLGLEDEQPVEAGALTWQVDVAGAQPTSARVALVLVDPIGRAGVPLFIEAGA